MRNFKVCVVLYDNEKFGVLILFPNIFQMGGNMEEWGNESDGL